jgi:pimeloyl-ACP methyl ester carboxylesterase
MQPRLASVQCVHPGGLHRMAYADWGDADNPEVVVCVHGLSRNGRDFDAVARALMGSHRVVCPDIVGRGRSDPLPDYRGYGFPQYVADCVTLIARLDVERICWVGTSMGGLIGMMIAAMAGNPISRLVINDVGPVLGQEGLARIGRSVGTKTEFDSFEEGVAYVTQVSATFGPHSPEQWRALSEHIVLERDGKWRMHYDPRIGDATRAALASPAGGDLWPVWDQVRCPTLVLRGAESDLLEDAVAQAMTTRGPKASLISYAGVGHAPALVQPDQVADVVRFIREAAPV